MSGGNGRATTCDRCGRHIHTNHSRKKPVTVCADCRYADPRYLQLVTQHTKEHAA